MKLAEVLHISEVTAVGHLVYLWLWALDNAQDGDLTNIADVSLAKAARYTRGSAKFVLGLTQAGFLSINENTRELHDWFVYAGKLIAQREIQREQTNERVKKFREKVKKQKVEECNADVTRNCNASVTPCNAPTVPNPTVPYKEEEGERDKPPIQTDDGYKKIIAAFTQIHPPSPVEAERLSDWMEDIEPDAIVLAIKEAITHGAFNLAYVNTILNNWLKNGIKTKAAVEAYLRKQQDLKNQTKGTGTSPPGRVKGRM
jgi:DnaD/phage-associated family protein